ncbi:MAG TPA: RHS repeat-associated core domain-containing protein [Candidatus Binataceae bacterium]
MWAAELKPGSGAAAAGARQAGPSSAREVSDGGPGVFDGPHFSSPPSDLEILVSGVLPQPLAPLDGPVEATENRALAQALIQYQGALRRDASRDAVAPLTDFLRAYPTSRWRAALDLNLGIIFRQTGHMSRALAAWQRAWDLSRHATEPNARALADYSVGQLAEFEAYLGRIENLAPLLAEVKGRPMHGSGAANISAASQGLAEMRTRPQDAFRCGPMALHRICLLQHRTDGVLKLEQSRSTTRGTSLVQVAELAHQVGLNYQMAYRTAGAPVIVPAVMHWKVGHFAAIIKRSGGRYQLEDPTFGENILVSKATLDDEQSGYFLVPVGPLPKGWRPVAQIEGARIWGRGFTSSQAAAAVNAILAYVKCFFGVGMTTANAQASTVSLVLHDAPLSYQTPKGPPVSFELFYSHRDAQQPAIFTYTNFGPKWTSNWISYFTDNVKTTNTADLYAPGGGVESYVPTGDLTPTGGMIFVPGADDQALVTSLVSAGHTVGFTRELPDGSIQTFARRFGTNQYFLSSVADPQGNRVTLTYDPNITGPRIMTITDAAGEKTSLFYADSADKFKVTKVTDPFLRSALFTYNSDGDLASITDTLGITSTYTYLFDSGDFIRSLTTPYGISTFTYGDSTTDYRLGTSIFLTMTDPMGQTQRVEFRQQAPGIPDSDPSNTVPKGMPTNNQFLSFRDTFVWTAHQLAIATLPDGEFEYTKAKMLHFLHAANFSQTSGVLESVKEPLENRVWYSYPGSGLSVGSSNQPSAVGRVLDDGSTQLLTFQRNSFGLITQVTDPIGRQRSMTYAANGIDLLTLSNTTAAANQRLLGATYNSQHEPLTVTDPAGQITKYSYNAAGQVLTKTDALKQTTSYTYGATGLQLSTVRPFTGALTKYTYDGFNRLSSATEQSQAYQLLFGYDAADRPTLIQYPDSTTFRLAYKLLNLAAVTDRLKRTTTYTYDSLGRPTQMKDPLGRTTTFGYCDCGAVSKLIDPNGNVTDFIYDLQERLSKKVFPDGTSTALGYEQTTSRIRSQTDALGQVTFLTYNIDNTPRAKTYLHAIHPTAPVSYAWDPAFRRLIAMIDGVGKTTYSYNPITGPPAPGAGLPARVIGQRGDTEQFAYDALGRAAKVTLDGAASQFAFDSLGRMTSEQNALDTFSIGYLGATELPTSVKSGKGPFTNYAYFANTGDVRLKSISNNSFGGALISAFGYSYDADGEVTSTVIQKQFATTVTRSMSYDAAGQLLSLAAAGGGNNYAFGYDARSNRTSEKVASTAIAFAYNSLNQLTSPGPASYDKDGEPLTLGSLSAQWDAAGRLISVATGTRTTRFAYDGFDRRTRITQLTGTTVTSDKFYFWCGNNPCLETDATSKAVTKRYFSEGVVANGQPLYYARDNLGSVRGLITASGIVTVSFDYDPYGVRTRLAGTANSDFGFAGLFHESQSGLDLALYRAYDSSLARWLNRDPIGENGGVNLYAYVFNDPFGFVDPLGLACFNFGFSILKNIAFGVIGGTFTIIGGAILLPEVVITGAGLAVGLGVSTAVGVYQDYISSDPNYKSPGITLTNIKTTGAGTLIGGVLGYIIERSPPAALATAVGAGISIIVGIVLDSVTSPAPAKSPPPSILAPPLRNPATGH